MATARGAPRATPPPDEEKLSVKTLSRSVAAVVESAGELSYADLAAATAAELARTHSDARKDTDDRTFRRRIYDVVAVLAAAGVVARRHSSVSWKGFPSSAAPRPRVSSEDAVIAELTQKINEKRDALKKAQEANALLHRLAERNALVEAGVGPTGPVPPERRIPLPFILLTTDADAQVDLQISDTSSELLFKFTHPFEIHDDQQSLRLLNITNPPVIPAQFSEFSVQEEVPLPQTDQFSTLLSSLDGIGMDLEMPGSVTDSWAGDVDFQNAGFGGQPDGPFATDQKMEGLSTIQDDDFEALINFVAW